MNTSTHQQISLQTADVSFLSLPRPNASIQQISGLLDQYEQHPIANGWFESFPYQPKVAFSVAHGGHCLYLKYYVHEQEVLARFLSSNDPVYRDSCVELFIAFDEESYYNLEFNSLGTCLMEFGSSREDRIQVSPSLIHTIKSYATLARESEEEQEEVISWQLTLVIPLSVFYRHSLTSLAGKSVRANVQKCGDDTAQPHFLSWNKIDTPAPDFHQPRFFGEWRFL